MADAHPILLVAIEPRALALLAQVAGSHPILLAGLAGFFCALLFACIPVGPINLTILNEGAQRGFVWAFCIGFGAAIMDTTYCAISFTGLSQFFDHGFVQAFMQVMGFVFLLFLGCKFLLAQSVKVPTKLDSASEKLGARIAQKIHPHSAFATGFVRVMGNPGVFLFWIFLAALFRAHDWVEPSVAGTFWCVTGVAGGTSLWFCGLSYFVSRGTGKLTEHTLLRTEQFSGICLLLMAVGQGAHIVWQMVQHEL